MKKLLFAFVVMALIACDDDNDDGGGTTTPFTKDQIVGAWNGDEIEYRYVKPGIIDTSEFEDITPYTVTFNNDMTGNVDSSGIQVDAFDWALIGDNQMVFYEDTMDIETLSGTNFNFSITYVEDPSNGIMTIQTIKLVK